MLKGKEKELISILTIIDEESKKIMLDLETKDRRILDLETSLLDHSNSHSASIKAPQNKNEEPGEEDIGTSRSNINKSQSFPRANTVNHPA